jgi:hypothetical protein
MFVLVSVIGSSRTVANALARSGRAVAEAGGHIMASVRRLPAVCGYLQVTDTDEVFGTLRPEMPGLADRAATRPR